jgi:hypothetical protein
VNGGRADIEQNTVICLGPVNFIAQNGIQAGYGADVKIQNNFVAGNSYTGAGLTASGGILLVGGACYGGDLQTNTRVQNNAAINNDVGVWFSNLDASCGPATTPTKNTAQNNSLANNAINNKTGNGATQGYQAGISDQGDFDTIQNNDICGLGYQGPGDASAALFAIDVTSTNNPVVRHNSICGTDSDSHGHNGVSRARSGGPAPHGVIATPVN